MLELALLGLLREAPVHGYELRKQLVLRLGGLRAYSYGSLYPATISRRYIRARREAVTVGARGLP